MIISEIQSEIGHCSCDSAKFKAPADFSHHAILCMTLSLIVEQHVIHMQVDILWQSQWQLFWAQLKLGVNPGII